MTSLTLSLTLSFVLSFVLSLALSSDALFTTIKSAHAHAWRGQSVVLFVTYEIRDDEVRGTLGLPAPLLRAELIKWERGQATLAGAQRKDSAESQGEEQVTPRTLGALYTSEGGPRRIVSALSGLIARDLPIYIDRAHLVSPRLKRVDLILSARHVPEASRDERQVTSVEGVEVEVHRGAPSALVVNFSVPLLKPPRELSLRWQSPRWFVKRGRRGRRRSQINTREVSGIVIDREQITPLTFTPTEPEVIWRAPNALSTLRRSPKLGQQTPERPRGKVQDKSQDTRSRAEESQESQTPTSRFKSLHTSIYTAFKHEHDEAIYDALSLSLAGPALDEVFSSVYRALIMRDEGGARAQVTHVIERELKELSPDRANTPKLRAHLKTLTEPHHIFHYHWRVAGEVSHWGHTHRRVHDYKALYVMTKKSSGWRITHATPLKQTRRPELEGGL